MRDLWIDNGNGILTIETNTLRCQLASKARKNYRHTQSNWSLYFVVKGRYGYMARIFDTFGDTMEGAMTRAETMMLEMFEAIQEII